MGCGGVLRRIRTGVGMWGGGLAATLLLGGCSSIPNSVNPVHWVESGYDWVVGSSPSPSAEEEAEHPVDTSGGKVALPDDKRPIPSSHTNQQKVAEGLVADRSNAQYTQQAINRQGDPTRPLTTGQAVAAAPPPAAAAPVPVVAAATAPVSAGASVASAAAAPTVTERAIDAVAASGGVMAVYRDRLAEFNRGIGASGSAGPSFNVAEVSPQPPSAAAEPAAQGEPIALRPPARWHRAGGASGGEAQPLASYDAAARYAASFEVAALDFGEGTAALTPAGEAHLREVAALYRQTHGTIRIVGRSHSSRLEVDPIANEEANRVLAGRRADAAAAELRRLGVPARKIYAGPAADPQMMAMAESTDVYITY